MKTIFFAGVAAGAFFPVAAGAQSIAAQQEAARDMLSSPERAGASMVQIEPGRASEVSILASTDARSGPPAMDITYHGEPLSRRAAAGGMTPAFGETALSDSPGETAAAATEGASAPAESEQEAMPEAAEGEGTDGGVEPEQPDTEASEED